MTALFVQMFFAWRVKVLTGKMPAVILIAFCSLCQWCKRPSAVAVSQSAHYVQAAVSEQPLPWGCFPSSPTSTSLRSL